MPRMSRYWKALELGRRRLKMILLFLGGLLAAAVVYQKLGEHRDARRFSPPGRVLSIDGRRLHFSTQ